MESSPRPGAPRQVRIAAALFALTILLGLLKLGRTLSLPGGAGAHGFTVFAFVAIYSIMALLTIYLAMGAGWARQGLLALYVLGVLPGLPLVFRAFEVIPWLAAFTGMQVAAAAAGLFLVFSEPAAGWFRAAGRAARGRGGD